MSNIAKIEQPHEIAPQQATTPAALLSIAVQQGADLQKLEKLMELQERWEKNEARKAFDAAISAAKSEIKPIVKNRTVDFTSQKGRTNYEYEDLAAIADAVDPILAKYGLSYRHRSNQEGKLLTVTCILSHRDGHFEETSLSASNDESGNKNAIQSIGSAATYLQRYTLKLALGLAATKDDDGAGSEPIQRVTENQAADIQCMLDEIYTPENMQIQRANLLAYLSRAGKMEIKNIAAIPANMYGQTVNVIKQKGKSK